MSNTLLNINMVTKEAVMLFLNSNAFIQSINRQYDDQFQRDGAKIGTTLRIRLPNDYTVTTGPAISVQDTAEQSSTLTVATQKHVDISFSSVERSMNIDDYSARYLKPMVNNLAGAVASDIMTGAEAICNYVANVDGSNNVLSPTLTTFATARAKLSQASAPLGNRKLIVDPLTNARTVSTFSTLFNPAPTIAKNFADGMVGSALGFDWMEDQTILTHTAGTFSAGTVSGGSQTGSTITTNAITGTLNKGDIITFALVNAVNRVTKTSQGQLRQFVVTANVLTGATSIPIYPALIPGSGGNAVQFQTVDVSPLNSANILLVNKASEVTRKNFAFCPEAVTMVTADLVMPKGVHEVARESYDGLSMRMLTDYLTGTDQLVTRLDILYGYLWVRPEWAVVISDAL